jgi:hypothetical protein
MVSPVVSGCSPKRVEQDRLIRGAEAVNRLTLNSMLALSFCLAAAVLLAFQQSHAQSAYVSYQGLLTDPGGLPLNGTVSMTFRIYDDPNSTSPADLLWQEVQPAVDVIDGIYNVHLGSVTSFDTVQPSQTGQFWLEVEVDGEILQPRQLITSVFFALQSNEAGHADTTNDAEMLDGRDSTDFLDKDTYDVDRNAVVDEAESAAHATQADNATQAGNADTVDDMHADELQQRVYGTCPAGNSIREIDQAGNVVCEADDEGITSESDPTVNSLGKATLPCLAGEVAKSNGVSWGCAPDDASATSYTAGTGLDLNGTEFSVELPLILSSSSSSGTIQSSSSTGTGMLGHATAATGETNGVHGKSDSTGGRGVFGENLAVSGVTSGVYGRSYSTSGRGVYGAAHATTGVTSGVRGWSASTSGRGVLGVAAAASGSTVGVRGDSSSPDGYGVHGLATSTSGSTVGVRGQSASPDGTGVAGVSLAISGSSTGVWGKTSSPTGFGVYGEAPGTTGTGVYGSSAAGKAGHFVGAGSGVAGATVYGENSNASGIAGFFQNDSDDATAVFVQQGTGDVLRGFYDTGSGWDWAIRVQRNGTTTLSVLELTGGADLSEQFDVSGAEHEVSPGMVVSIDPDHPGRLRVSDTAYDRKVAGILSGAGGVKPGMLMVQKGSAADGANPVALTGRVYCWADASYGGIEPGDMLTTSDTPGHAMRVADHTRAQGAILGKAMTGLEPGERGLVLVLVTLQ